MTDMTEHLDPFALAGDPDPLLVLWAEKERVEHQLRAIPDDLPAEDEEALWRPMCSRLRAIEDRIAATVPQSLGGAIVLLKLLRQHTEDFEWGDYADRIADNLRAGLEALQ